MIHCPYCGKKLPDGVVECLQKVEGESSERKGVPWYFSKPTLILGFLFVGPFILPFVWFHPTYSQKTKIIVTIIALAVSWVLGKVVLSSFCNIKQYYGIMHGNY